MEEVVIVSAVRTPIGSFMGALSPLSATALGGVAVAEAVHRAGIEPGVVDEVLLGNVLSAGLGQAPARQAARAAGLPDHVGATTINKVCGSGLKAVMLGAAQIRAGDAQVIVAGGMESMSNAPYLLPKARAGLRMGHGQLLDAMIHDGLWDPYHDYHMGATGELVASRYPVSRAESDRYALASYEKALRAQSSGAFAAEIVPVPLPARKSSRTPAGAESVVVDEEPRETSLEQLAALRPAFQSDGTITAGNASKISDGAAALVLMSAGRAAENGIRPLARIVATAQHAREPEWVMMAPAPAVRTLLAKAGKSVSEIDFFEINEPFAAAAVALTRELALPEERVNISGGAVALGHPIGATGARILTTLVHGLLRTGGRLGVAALCLGGGEAVAVMVEAINHG
jgi:acetyl-CoA C-acetyltransferase